MKWCVSLIVDGAYFHALAHVVVLGKPKAVPLRGENRPELPDEDC